jgi:hypothetical protein
MTAQPLTVRRLPTIVPFLAAVLVAACGAGTGDLGPVATPAPTPGDSIVAPSAEPTPAVTTSPEGTPASSPLGTTTVRAYFFLGSFTGNAGLVPVLRDVPKTTAVGSAAITALLGGPNDAEMAARPALYTSIQKGVRFLGLTIDGGVATIDLSREMWSGDTHTIDQVIGQVVFTLTQFPTVTSVRFEADGEPAAGGYAGPYVRSDFPLLLPPIWVDRPAWGGVLGNPGRVTGLANVFEATFRIEVLDGSGHTLTDVMAMATCGTGCRGTFDVTVRYTVDAPQWGILRVYGRSAKDGSREHIVDYPVWLTPAS